LADITTGRWAFVNVARAGAPITVDARPESGPALTGSICRETVIRPSEPKSNAK
jgi:hypothetical protein